MKFVEWLSQLLNIVTGGDPDESFSARSYRQNHSRVAKIDRALRWIEDDHCMRSYFRTRERQLKRYGVKP